MKPTSSSVAIRFTITNHWTSDIPLWWLRWSSSDKFYGASGGPLKRETSSTIASGNKSGSDRFTFNFTDANGALWGTKYQEGIYLTTGPGPVDVEVHASSAGVGWVMVTSQDGKHQSKLDIYRKS